jgi:hypothetical protein
MVKKTFASTEAYNAAHPERAIPARRVFDEELTHLSLGAEDERPCDVVVTFLPGSLDGDWEKVGNVVARDFAGGGRVDLLATDVSLRAAFEAVLAHSETSRVARALAG